MKLPALIGSCLLFCLSGAATQAQTTTGSTGISVTIFSTTGLCRYPLVVNADYSTNLVTNIQPVGILKICSNNPKGFNLSISSQNGGQLRNTQDSNYRFNYRVNAASAAAVGGGDGYDIITNKGGVIAPAFQPTTTPTRFYTSPNGAQCTVGQRTGCDVGVQWQITTTIQMPQGSYTDILYYTLAANN